METAREEFAAKGIKFSRRENEVEIARAFLYILKNDLHQQPFGLIEDVYVEESRRGQGIATELTRELIEEARKAGCYKLILTSRHEKTKVHSMYERLGFKNHGLEFRMDF